MINESSTPGVQDGEQTQLRAQAFGIGSQILQSSSAGLKEQPTTQLGMRAQPSSQRVGQGEGDHEIGDRQEELSVVLEPSLCVGASALWTVPVIAGVVSVVEGAALSAAIERATLSRGAAGQDFVQHLTLTSGHG